MAKKTVAAETMEIGKKGTGKHWTESEVTARHEAAEKLKRKKAAQLKPPRSLSKDARAVWSGKIKQLAGLKASSELLDILDTDVLALYCDAVSQYWKVAKKRNKTVDDIKELQAWSRIIGAYAEKLGFTPSSRVRLVKKIADDKPDKFGKQFD